MWSGVIGATASASFPILPAMSTRPIALSTAWQMASQAAMAVLSVLSAKFVALALTKELAGTYNSAYGYLQIFAILADFGLYAVAVREVSKAREEDRETMLGSLLTLRATITALAFGAAILSVYVMPSWRGTPFPPSVAISSLVPIFTLLAGMVRAVFQVKYRMQYVFVAEVLQRILTTVGIGAFVLAGASYSADPRVLYAFLWIGNAGALLLLLVSFFYGARLMRIRPHFDRTMLKRVLLLAAPYGVTYIFITLYRQLDVVFIALLRPDFAIQNAYYGIAGRVEDMAFLVPTLLLNSLLPMFSAREAEGADTRSLLGKTFFLLLLLGSPFVLFSVLWAAPLTRMFATDDYVGVGYAGADAGFRLMGPTMFLNGIVLFCFYVSLAKHSWKRLMATFACGVAITVILNLLWTPAYGFVGAGSALIVAQVVISAILLPLTLKQTPMHLRASQLARWAAFTALLGVGLWLTAPLLDSGMRAFVGCLIALPAMAALAWGTGVVKKVRG